MINEGYRFTNLITNEVTLYTSASLAKTISGILFNNLKIRRGTLTVSPKFSEAVLTFYFPYTSAFANSLFQTTFEDEIQVEVFRDTGLYWLGYIHEISAQEVEIIVACRGLQRRFNLPGATERTSISCTYQVYDPFTCKLNSSTVGEVKAVTNFSGVSLPISTQKAAGYYINGTVTFGKISRHILNHTQGIIILDKSFPAPITGNLTLKPTCNLTYANCQTLNNTLNFGGMLYLPTKKNPFGSSGSL